MSSKRMDLERLQKNPPPFTALQRVKEKKPETETGYGTTGTTKRLEIYRGEDVPFRVIDTIGFEPTFFQKTKAINAIKKWSKESAKKSEKKEAEEEDNRQIHVIWFCIEGTRRKLFRDSIRNMLRATHMWKPIS